ncbi:MAG: hypothetical protein J2O44_05080 [Porphyrobacter sp.]|nr:hypothetical protein [Porphyrobacter sp.]
MQTAVKRLLMLGAVAGSFVASPTLAATQGSLGATSTGTVSISASVPNRARITGLTDVTFANQDPNTAASSAQDVCVWSNTATKGYTIKATGSGASSAFTLSNGTTTVPYSVEWAATSGQTSGTALTAGTASSSLTSGAVDQTCSSAPTASATLLVKIGTTDLGGMTAGGSYTGTLTLLVTPQ